IIKTSGPKDYVVEVEGQYIHEDTRSWWLTPTFAKGVGVFGLGVVSGVGLAALYSYLNGSQDGYSSARVSGPEYTYNPTPSDAATHSPTPLDATIYHDATGYHSTLSDVATPIVLVRNASECVSSGADKCGVGPIKPPFDGASMISAQELAVLKAGSCREAFADLKAPLIEATMNGWEQLDWSDCADSGGWVICTDDRSSISECYSFGFPYRFDFPTVWEAVVHRLKPSKCSFRCNKRLVAYRKYLQRGWVLTESIGEDPFRSSERHIHDVGLAYPGLDYYGQSGCSQRYEDHCEPRISGADCYCPEATFWANVTAPSGKKIRWGTINHINTYAEDLIRYYTAFKRRGYKVTQCGFECRRLQKSSFDDALHVTQLAFYHGPLAGEPPMNRSRYLDSLFL
ncbi:putative transmembrane protein, partial [Gregarina niphandrodes]